MKKCFVVGNRVGDAFNLLGVFYHEKNATDFCKKYILDNIIKWNDESLEGNVVRNISISEKIKIEEVDILDEL